MFTRFPVKQLPVGYEGARNTRCTDRFVKYPYPKVLYSYYRSQYHNKLGDTRVQSHKKAFNLEKEAKIINPHKMELSTTNNVTYRGKKGFPKDAPKEPAQDQPKPIVQMSSYMASFPNWDNGKKDVFHEKHPQYPFYSLPFRGDSTYKQTHTDRTQDLKRLNKLTSAKDQNKIK